MRSELRKPFPGQAARPYHLIRQVMSGWLTCEREVQTLY